LPSDLVSADPALLATVHPSSICVAAGAARGGFRRADPRPPVYRNC
jgi:hypothetical protein